MVFERFFNGVQPFSMVQVSPDLQRTNGLGGDNMTAVLVVLKSRKEASEVEAHLAKALCP